MILFNLIKYLLFIINWPVWSLMPPETPLIGSNGVKLLKQKYILPKKTSFDTSYTDSGDRKKNAVIRSKFYKKLFAPGFFGVGHLQVGAKKFNHPKDKEENGTNVLPALENTTPITTTVITNSKQKLFDDEHECITANAGLPCLCHMADFLERLSGTLAATTVVDVSIFKCPSYKTTPIDFVVVPPVLDDDSNNNHNETTTTPSGHIILEQEPVEGNNRGGSIAKVSYKTSLRKKVNFDEVINYQLDQESNNDHYAIQYGLVGGDVEVQCLVNGDNSNYTAYKWDYKKDKHKTNTTITGENMKNMMIWHLEPAATKNYTCIPAIGEIGHLINDSSYKHYVIVVDTPVYEIHGKATYTTDGGCETEIIGPLQKQLPSFVRNELCPEAHGSSRYACNVLIEMPKCAEDKRTVEINYLVTLNIKSSFLNKLRTCNDALYYQKLLARISNVLAENLNKTMTIQITSKTSLIDTRFESDLQRTTMNMFVSCGPGFGIREVFCGACPPHHYSPDGSVDCFRCSKGFHQPVAGSAKCVKCPSFFVPGCNMKEVASPYLALFICALVKLSIIFSCVCCCREENEKDIKIIPKKLRKRFNRKKTYNVLSIDKKDREDSSGTSLRKNTKIKKRVSSTGPKQRTTNLNTPLDFVQEKYTQKIQID